MLTAGRNELLTRVGRGTPVGELFRRYWLPALLATRGARALVALLALAGLAPFFVAAQDSRGVLAALAAYEGADRHQRLLEGARREGFLSLYTSFPPEDVATLNAAFERKYGVKVRAWRAASEKVLQDRKSTRLNSSHSQISYAVFCLKKKKTYNT